MATQPAVNRDGLWLIYHRRTRKVVEVEPERARELLDRGSHVVGPGAKPSDWDSRPVWTLKTDPETYLKRNPDGPNAELARQVLDREGGETPEADEESVEEG